MLCSIKYKYKYNNNVYNNTTDLDLNSDFKSGFRFLSFVPLCNMKLTKPLVHAGTSKGEEVGIFGILIFNSNVDSRF